MSNDLIIDDFDLTPLQIELLEDTFDLLKDMIGKDKYRDHQLLIALNVIEGYLDDASFREVNDE